MQKLEMLSEKQTERKSAGAVAQVCSRVPAWQVQESEFNPTKRTNRQNNP